MVRVALAERLTLFFCTFFSKTLQSEKLYLSLWCYNNRTSNEAGSSKSNYMEFLTYIYLLSSAMCLAEAFKLSSQIHKSDASINKKCAIISALFFIAFTPVLNTWMCIDSFINLKK